MTIAIAICSVLLVTGAGLALYRAQKGPTMLDRTIALDIIITSLICGAGIYIAVFKRTDVVPILVALSMVGFIGSTTIARFAAGEPDAERRLQSRAEADWYEMEERRRLAATEADEVAHEIQVQEAEDEARRAALAKRKSAASGGSES